MNQKWGEADIVKCASGGRNHGEARKDEGWDTEAADGGLAPVPGGVAPGQQKRLADCHKGTLIIC